MIEYRAFLTDSAGKFIGVFEFVATSDDDALAIAERHAHGQPYELWQGPKFVNRRTEAAATDQRA